MRFSKVCPTVAIGLVMADGARTSALVASEELEVLRPELNDQPRVYYKNQYLRNKAFIAGVVVFVDTDECGEGAVVTVIVGGKKVGGATADSYGDFWVDKLEPGTEYWLAVEAARYAAFAKTVKLEESLNIGTVDLRGRGGFIGRSKRGWALGIGEPNLAARGRQASVLAVVGEDPLRPV